MSEQIATVVKQVHGNGSVAEDHRAAKFARLRDPFPPDQVGKLPKPTKKENQKGKCKPAAEGGAAPGWQDYFCGGWHGLPAVHLDYVGHAAVTSRLCDVDPAWTWEPKGGWDDNGEPKFVRSAKGEPIRLWIDLTVLGVTRPGVGTVSPGGFDPEKQLIGDALRNAAMRFGVAVDLWIKGSDEEQAVSTEPAPVDPDHWAREHGWADQAAHDAYRAETIAIRNALHPDDRAAFREWCETNEHAMNRGNPKDEAEALRRQVEILRDTREGRGDETPDVKEPGRDVQETGHQLGPVPDPVDDKGRSMGDPTKPPWPDSEGRPF